jgi:hypothetical protein
MYSTSYDQPNDYSRRRKLGLASQVERCDTPIRLGAGRGENLEEKNPINQMFVCTGESGAGVMGRAVR